MIRRYLLCMLMCIAASASPSYAFEGYGWIGGTEDDSPYDLAYDCEGENWTWNAEGAVLTLYEGYDKSVFIDCDSDSTVYIDVNGDVNIQDDNCGSAIITTGTLNISGNGTLTVNPSKVAVDSYSIPTIKAKNIIFSGAHVIASSDRELNRTIIAEGGYVHITEDSEVILYSRGDRAYTLYANEEVIINENAQLRSESYGENGAGILVTDGNFSVKDAAQVYIAVRDAGYALEIQQGSVDIENNNNIVIHADNSSPEIKTSSFPSGNIGEFYEVLLSADGTVPITWFIESGNLPDGLELESETGIICGIPKEYGIKKFAVRASNIAGYDTREFTINILSSDSNPAPTPTPEQTPTPTPEPDIDVQTPSFTSKGGGGGCDSMYAGMMMLLCVYVCLRKN